MKSNRRDFLRLTGMAGTAALLPLKGILASDAIPSKTEECILIPTETAGPLPLDLSDSLVYQLEVINTNGAFKDCRMMTGSR